MFKNDFYKTVFDSKDKKLKSNKFSHSKLIVNENSKNSVIKEINDIILSLSLNEFEKKINNLSLIFDEKLETKMNENKNFLTQKIKEIELKSDKEFKNLDLKITLFVERLEKEFKSKFSEILKKNKGTSDNNIVFSGVFYILVIF